ncbi:MAG TPA: DUF1835 domain-containing protein [Vicinamibacterales bacterium]|nr:DUF1835 domain-containing protein [Vicinamibacterales bacterium]
MLNGDSVRVGLEQSGVPGTFSTWADVLHEGPVPYVWGDEWCRARAGYLASAGYAPEPQALDRYRATDAALERFAEYGEVVFWFEHDLYDQLLLIRHLGWLSRLPKRHDTRFTLICIGSFPGISDFVGLGQLTPAQLAPLFDTRRPLTQGQIDLGARAWRDFCGPDPRALESLASEPSDELPFLAGALQRHLQDFPSIVNGLARSEAHILQALASGISSPSDVFRAVGRTEERVFMGDTSFWTIARRLAGAAHPPIALAVSAASPAVSLPSGTMTLTATGRDLLANRTDYVTQSGIDRWMGGVHLTPGNLFRWDGRKVRMSG